MQEHADSIKTYTLVFLSLLLLTGATTVVATIDLGAFNVVMALLIAGIVQVYFQRVLGMEYLETQGHMRLWYEVVLVAGCVFFVGTVLVLWDLLRLCRILPAGERTSEPSPEAVPGD